jgi:creatinine amidohydrolase
MSKTFAVFGAGFMRLALFSTIFASVSWCQGTPPMRTRYLTSLTNAEIEEYLQRNDIIFVPVGTVEVHGGLPVDCEYVGPLAWSLKLAEEVDGLVLPYLAYFYPGGTAPAKGTVEIMPSEGLAYLKVIARSLLRQGFRRQIYITGHGPSFETLSPLIREFFDETHCPILYLSTGALRGGTQSQGGRGGRGAPAQGGRGTQPGGSQNAMMCGAYSIVGRLEDIPVNMSHPMPPHPTDQALSKLEALGPGSGTIGYYFGDPGEHGGAFTAITAEQRAALAKEGVAQIEATVKGSDIKGIVQAMRDHDRFTQEVVLPKYGSTIPNAVSR